MKRKQQQLEEQREIPDDENIGRTLQKAGEHEDNPADKGEHGENPADNRREPRGNPAETGRTQSLEHLPLARDLNHSRKVFFTGEAEESRRHSINPPPFGTTNLHVK